jgi:hypothetical protein
MIDDGDDDDDDEEEEEEEEEEDDDDIPVWSSCWKENWQERSKYWDKPQILIFHLLGSCSYQVQNNFLTTQKRYEYILFRTEEANGRM